MIDGIIFDLDGTLWDSTAEVAIAFNKVLKRKYPEISVEVTRERLMELFGLPLDVIGKKLFTSVSEEKAVEIIEECCSYECEYLAAHGAKLYDELESTLHKLKEKHSLFIVSNCQEGYIQCFFKAYPQLEEYFIDYEYPGRSGKLKADNIKLVIERNGLKNPIYVGDTQGDATAAIEAGVPFVYATYGFGTVTAFDYAIDSIAELVTLV